MRRSNFLVSIPTILLIVVALLGFSNDNQYFEITRNLDIFTTLYKEVNAYYVDEVDPQIFIRRGINAMLSSLDPYTSFISEEEIESYRTMTTGQYGGVGVVVSSLDDKAYVVMVYENFSAHNAGILIGDEIIKIDGKPVTSKKPIEVTESLKGVPETVVNIVIRREGEPELLTFKLKREKISINNVSYIGVIHDKFGYVLLSNFTYGAAKEVSNAITHLKSNGVEGIILDIRGNPGGLLSEAVNVSNVFIPKGKEIVSTKGKVEEWNKSYAALNMPVDVNIPLVVLINKASASASEIVAGVMQDYDRGVLVGRKTFGKGLVQTTRPLAYNTQLKITAAKYYTPSGRCIQRVDYSKTDNNENKNPPDTLKSKFRTLNGRLVYDGGGLTPDIEVKGKKMSAITKSLVNNGYIFRYANVYHSNHSTIDPSRQFQISVEEYDEFKEWCNNQNLKYSTLEENNLNALSNAAKKEMIYDKINAELDALIEGVERSKLNDLDKFSDEIKLVLQKEIASRYYLFKGNIDATIYQDNDIGKAVELLSNEKLYNKILEK